MSETQNYFYLRLKENFFDSDSMILLENMKDGYIYANILLKLYLRSLKNGGRLMLNDTIPYNPEMLASVTRHSVGDIEKALRIFKDLNLIEILDSGAIYITDIQSFIGKSTTEADRKRKYREMIELEKKAPIMLNGTNVQTNVGQISDKYPPYKSKEDLEIEIEKEIEKDNTSSEILQIPDRIPYQKIVDAFNEICTSLTKVKGLTEGRKSAIKARYKDLNYSMDKVKEYFTQVQKSDFLTGKVEREDKRPFKATFDWVIKSANYVKIIEGNYENKEASYGTSGKHSTEVKNTSKWGKLEGIIHL
jgi:predicted phage replisome organizer